MNQPDKLRNLLPAMMAVVAVIASLVWFFTALHKEVRKFPKVLGHREGCVVCHLPMGGFVKAHDPKILGCASCHLGNPFTMDKRNAHRDMVLVPGNLADAARTCGTSECHPLLSTNIHASLMATGRGMVSVDRYVFGEISSPDGQGHLSRLGDSPAQDHLRKLCASCHLAKIKSRPAPISQLSRGGGCTACHLQYEKEARTQLDRYGEKGKLPRVHPALSLQVGGSHCFGCHSRSGRIATNYEGWHETEFKPERVAGKAGFRILEDGRAFMRMSPDIHFKRGMECIDCHTWREAMGDGKRYFHEEAQVEISCEDCHPLRKPHTIAREKVNEIDKKIVNQRKTLEGITNFVLTSKTNHPLLNVTLDRTGHVLVKGKNSSRTYHPKVPPLICRNQVYGHGRLTCQSCHTPWAPSCIKCHTSYNKTGMGLDHVTEKRVKGRWVEKKGKLLPRQPALGIQIKKGKERIDTFIPGMILTIDHKDYPGAPSRKKGAVFRRLYAPTAAHTTSAKGLDCQSCHKNAVALGLGEGLLSEKERASKLQSMVFHPLYPARKEDGLAEDAWTGFLDERKGMLSTRVGARPLSGKEQRKVIRVGICLSCHPANAAGIQNIYRDFPAAMKRLTPQCSTGP
jgi:hypothetical protein